MDDNGLRVSPSADFAQESQAVQARHMEIGDDDVKRPVLQTLKSPEAVLGSLGLIPVLSQSMKDPATRGKVIVHDQDAAPACFRLFHHCGQCSTLPFSTFWGTHTHVSCREACANGWST